MKKYDRAEEEEEKECVFSREPNIKLFITAIISKSGDNFEIKEELHYIQRIRLSGIY